MRNEDEIVNKEDMEKKKKRKEAYEFIKRKRDSKIKKSKKYKKRN